MKNEECAGFYRGESGWAYHEGKRWLDPAAFEWVCRLRAEKFRPWVLPSDVVFEFGLGSGWNLVRLPCARRIGCDVADFLAGRLEALGVEFHLDSQEVPDATADVAICHQTLEHLLEPPAALRELARILKPAGRLIVHVPWEIEFRYRHFRRDDPNRHFYHWNAQNLGNLASALGWRVECVHVRRYGYDRFAANLAARWHLGEAGFRLIRRLLVTVRPLREVELIALKGGWH
jgi:SAM-dependent methyltransferase